jgi:phosphate/sulfate permease
MELIIVALVILVLLAFFDLMVGVSNDAVNFLNSSVGSKVAPRNVIMIIASLGILVGVTFASGMMDVAKKGIFHPEFFTLPEVMTICLAVMLTDIYLLDLFNTFGLPTSTTVSIFFELIGASVAVSMVKIIKAGDMLSKISTYLNTGTILFIIAGILLSVAVSFLVGSFIQFLTRLLFTFDYGKRLRRYGSLWGGLALSAIVYFILIKGAKGASFMTPESLKWIATHTVLILFICFVFFALLLQLLNWLFKINVLKIVILAGTFALALAFAANDLVNFIGVPLAALGAFKTSTNLANPLTDMMTDSGSYEHPTWIFLLAGSIMVGTLWLSRKANKVMNTANDLGRQGEGLESFEASALSRTIVRMGTGISDAIGKRMPQRWREGINRRLDATSYHLNDGETSFDLVRAAVNLMVSAALISFGTAMKLPLSTTYVTFMVAMASSFADRAWDRDSAVYRISGVLTVIGGWFFTAVMAFSISGIFAAIISYGQGWAVLAILGLVGMLIAHNAKTSRKQEKSSQALDVFNLKKIKDARAAARITFKHAGIFLDKVAQTVEGSCEHLFCQDGTGLKNVRRHSKEIQNWSNIIIANIFKVLRLKDRGDMKTTRDYYNTIEALQEIAEAERDLLLRAYAHVSNHHKGMLSVQIDELREVKAILVSLLKQSSQSLLAGQCGDIDELRQKKNDLVKLMHRLDGVQISRIQNNTSKTRLSILFYGVMRDAEKMTDATLHLLDIFHETLENELEEAKADK